MQHQDPVDVIWHYLKDIKRYSVEMLRYFKPEGLRYLTNRRQLDFILNDIPK